MVPLLVIPPAVLPAPKTSAAVISIPAPAMIFPALPLTTLPKKVVLLASTPVLSAKMVPLLVIPPLNVVVFSTMMPLRADIMPLLETWMPPEMTPPMFTKMPALPAMIVPLSTIPPENTLALTTRIPI